MSHCVRPLWFLTPVPHPPILVTWYPTPSTSSSRLRSTLQKQMTLCQAESREPKKRRHASRRAPGLQCASGRLRDSTQYPTTDANESLPVLAATCIVARTWY